ncbi:helix-turn-helix transcriptional regulator [Phormidium sp. FACHB-592]|uniref:Helix-turn-helix domain-containing protein n=1 Tax=Stenomitos frigidus AS-A4 TaxID=2933935 RepID=A0ABV0KQN5_9CYAN|nr:helix-turn-helix transcriptional regulator [Phormidium sp. FACHB-592]MBD2073431.1 helix-turn-helix transcriptional regulator [Phormidium sp. FACHB-592]
MLIAKPSMLKQPEVGQFIRELRLLTELTQEQFAAALGVTYNTVNRWERGRMKPSRLALKQIEQLLSAQGDRVQPLTKKYFSETQA